MRPGSRAIDQVSKLLALQTDYRRITPFNHNLAEELPIKPLFDLDSRRDR